MSNFREEIGLPGLDSPERSLMRHAVELAELHRGVFSLETVKRCVFERYAEVLRTSTVRAHLLANTRKLSLNRLNTVARETGVTINLDPPMVIVEGAAF